MPPRTTVPATQWTDRPETKSAAARRRAKLRRVQGERKNGLVELADTLCAKVREKLDASSLPSEAVELDPSEVAWLETMLANLVLRSLTADSLLAHGESFKALHVAHAEYHEARERAIPLLREAKALLSSSGHGKPQPKSQIAAKKKQLATELSRIDTALANAEKIIGIRRQSNAGAFLGALRDLAGSTSWDVRSLQDLVTHVERRTQNDVSTPEKFLEDSTKALLHYLESGPRDSERMTAMLGYARLVAEARRLLSARNKSAMGRKNIGESLSTLKDERALREPSVFKKQALKAARTLGNILDGEAIAREHASDFVSRRDDESHGVAAIIETLSRDLSRALKMSEPICFEELEALSMAPSPSAISCATDVRAVLEKLAPADPSGETKKFDPKGFLTDVAPDFFRQRDKTEGDKRDQRKRPPARKTTPTGPIMAVPSEKRKFSTGPTPGHLQMIQERAREEQLRKEAAHRAALAEELAEITQETQGWLDRKDTLSSYDEDTVTKRLDEMLADMLTHRSNDGPALSGYQQAVSYLAVRDENRMRLAQLNGRRGYLISEIETSSGKKAGPKGQTRSRVASIVEDPSTELGRVSDEITAVEKTIAECDAGIAILAVEGLFQPEAYFLVRDVLGPWSSPARAGLSEAKAKSVSPQIPESESEYRTHVVTKLREALKESHRYRAQNSELRQAYDRITAYASMIAGAREAKKTYDDAVKAVKTLRHRVNNTLGATSLQNALAARKNEKGASWDSKETIIENLQQRYEALENAEACVTEVDFEGLMTDFETALSRHMDTLRSQDTGPHSQTA